MGSSPAHRRRTIVIVDDEQVVRDVLASALELEGFETATFADGDAMLLWLEGHSADGVIADCSMPGLDGPSLQKELKRRGHPLAERFLLISGANLRGAAEGGQERSMTPLLAKPFRIEEVAAALTKVLAGKGGPEPGPGDH
jgi:CheY-like chemotaxis protein